MSKIYRTLAPRCKSILGMIVAGMLLFGGATQAQNMNRYITLTVTKNSLIEIRLATDAANSPVRIVSGDSVYEFTTTSISETDATSYYARDSTMTIYGDVKNFWCTNNNDTIIIGIDVSQNTALTHLYCYNNQLTSLNVSGCTALTYLGCSSNQLTSLDVSGCTALTELSCSYNQLTSLDVSKNLALTNLYCGNNQLTSLDVSKNTALKVLSCDGNQLISLDVSKNTALKILSCYGNPFTTAGYDSIMCSLPFVSSGTGRFCPLYNSRDTNATIFAASNSRNAKAKKWNVQYSSGGAAISATTGDYECNGGGNPEDTTNVTEVNLSNIALYPNPAKTMLNIENATENVQIFDITGRLLINVENKETNLLEINVSELAKGMYFVKVGNYTTKFVKE